MARFNIVKEYDWTTIPRGSGYRNRAPRVYIKSYKVKSSSVVNRIANYTNVLSLQDPDQFYNNLYSDITDPEDEFWIPYLGDIARSFTNEYGDTFKSAFLGAVDTTLGAAVGMLGEFKEVFDKAVKSLKGEEDSDPGSYIETPKLYQYAQNDAGLDVSFVLDNTLNNDNSKNTELVNLLTKINRPKRENSIIMEPPRIYEVKLPGIRYMRWAYCSNFSVTLLGARRMIDDQIIPEGYLINMTFTSLTTEVSNFMDKI